MDSPITAIELSNMNDYLYVSQLLRRGCTIAQASLGTTIGGNRCSISDIEHKRDNGKMVTVTVSRSLLHSIQRNEWNAVDSGMIAARLTSSGARNNKISTPEIHSLIRRHQRVEPRNRPKLSRRSTEYTEALYVSQKSNLSSSYDWLRQPLIEVERCGQKSFQRANTYSSNNHRTYDPIQHSQLKSMHSTLLAHSVTELDDSRLRSATAKTSGFYGATSYRECELLCDRPRGAQFIDIVRRLHAKPGRQRTTFSAVGSGEQSLPELPEVPDTSTTTVIDRKLSVGATASSFSRPSTAASATFFANIRDLNEKIVSGKMNRRTSVVFAGQIRPTSSDTGSSRCTSAQSRRHSGTLVGLATCPNGSGNAISDSQTEQTLDDWNERLPESIKNQSAEFGSLSRRHRRIADDKTNNLLLQSRSALFYEAPLVPVEQQNTECKFYAGSNDEYRLPNRLPDRLTTL